MEASVTLSKNNNLEDEVEVPITLHPIDITTDRTYANGDDGTTEDFSYPPSIFPQLIDYHLARDRSKSSIVARERYFDFLFASKLACDDLIAYALSIVFELDNSKPKTFDDAMSSIDFSNWLIGLKIEFNSLI